MDGGAIRQLDYFAAKKTWKERGRWLGWTIAALVLLQILWFPPWMMLQRLVLEDGSLKKPLDDFFMYIGIAVPSIAILPLAAWYCWVHWRYNRARYRCIRMVIPFLLASYFVWAAVYSWYDDDVTNRNVPHGVW